MDIFDNKMNSCLFHYNANFLTYTYLGCHFTDSGCVFRVLAHNAEKVFLVGDFCDWRQGIPMRAINDLGVWEILVDYDCVSVGAGDKYKFKIFGNGEVHYTPDPYAFFSEGGPAFASIIYDINSDFLWSDNGWIQHRKAFVTKLSKRPLNIYELDIASWKHNADGSFYSYVQLANELAPYVKQMGYTHIQLVSHIEQGGSRFAPDSRFGDPSDFKLFVDSMHTAGIGVIVPINDFALCDDILTSVVYWLKEYHIDGLAFSCVDSLSLNIEDQELLERFTSYLKKAFPDVILIGEKNIGDCSGFDFKWDVARKNDVVLYAQEDPIFRKFHHEKLTYFSTYSLGEKYIFPITCAEDSAKESLLNITSGDYWQKFASARALLGYMMTVSGKKHTFMGTEIGQFCNWDRNGELDWSLLEYESHAKLQLYVSELNIFYLASKELWGTDNSEQSFKWIDANNRNQNIISYRRIDSRGNELVVIINFSPVVHESYQLGVSNMGEYIEVFNSDEIRFGGSGVINSEMLRADKSPYNYLPYSVSLRIPPLGMVILKHK